MPATIILDDIWERDATVIFCGSCVGKTSYDKKYYYANKGNRFWEVLKGVFNASITPEDLKNGYQEKLKKKRIGLTDLIKSEYGCERGIKASDDDVFKLRDKLIEKEPAFFAFNGKKAAWFFLHKLKLTKNKRNLAYGFFGDNALFKKTKIYILPNSSSQNSLWTKRDHVGEWKTLAKEAGYS